MDDVDLDESFHSDFSEELNLSVASIDDDASPAHLIQSTSSDLNGIESEVKLRKRGRPRKSDPLAATTTVTLKDRSNRSSDGDHLKSRRVRAEKAVAETENDTPPSSAARASPEPSSVESETTSQAAMDSTSDPQIVKRGRGRPKKSLSLNNSAVEDPEATTEPTSSTVPASSDLPEPAKKSVENTGEQSLAAEKTVEINGSITSTDDEATTTSPVLPSSSSERKERRGRPRKHQNTDTVVVPESTVDMPPQDTVVVPTAETEGLEDDDERMDLTMDTDTVSPVPSVRRGRPTKTAKKKKRISLSSLSTDAELIAYLKKNKKGGRYLQMMLQKKKKMELMMLRRGTPTVPVPLFERPGRGKKNLDVVMDSEATSSGGDIVMPEQEVTARKEEVVVPVRRPIGRPRKDQNQSLSDIERSPNGKTQTPTKPSELTIARVEEKREKKTEKAEKVGESERVSKRERRQTEHFDTASSSTVTGSNVSYESVNGKKIRTVRIARTSSVSEAVDEKQGAATRSSSSSVDTLSVPLVTNGDSTVPIIPTVPSKRTRSMTSLTQSRKSADRSTSSNNEIFGHAIIKRPSISSSIDRRSNSGIRSRENSIRRTEAEGADADSTKRANSTVSTRSVTLTEKPTSTVSDTDLIKKTKSTVSAGSAHKSKSDLSVTEKVNAYATAEGVEKSKSDVSSLEKPTSTVPTPDIPKKTNTTVDSAEKVKSSSADKEPTVSISDWPKKFSNPVPTVEKAEKTKSADKKPTSTVPTPTSDSAKKTSDTVTTLDSVQNPKDVVLPIDNIKKSTPAAPTGVVTKKEKTTVSSLSEEKTTVSHLNKDKSTVSHLKIGKRPHRSLPVEPERRSRNYPDTSGKERELRRERKKVKTFESEFGASYLKGEKKVKKEESSTKEEKEKNKETENADAVVEHLVGVIMKEARKQGEPSVTKTSESARRKSVQKTATMTVDAIILPEEDKEKEEKPSSEERSLRKRKATQVEEVVVVPEKRAKRESAEKTRKSMESEDTQRKAEIESSETKMEVEEKPTESSVSVKKWKKDKLSIQQQRRIRKLLQNAVYNEQRRKRRQEDRERREKGLPPIPRSPIKATTVEMTPVTVSTPLATGKRRSLRERKSREEVEREEKEREEIRMNNKSIMPEKKEEEEGKEETPEGDEVEDASEQGAEEENMADGEDYDHEDDLPLAVIQNNTRIPLQVPETPRLRQVVNLELPSFSPKLPEGDDAYPDRDTHLEIDMAILRPMVRIPIPCPPREIIGMDSDDECDLPDIKIRREKYILMNKGHEKRGRGKPRVLGGTPEVRIINIRNEMERLRSRFQALCEEATGILPELGENSVTRAVKHLMGQGPKDHVVS